MMRLALLGLMTDIDFGSIGAKQSRNGQLSHRKTACNLSNKVQLNLNRRLVCSGEPKVFL